MRACTFSGVRGPTGWPGAEGSRGRRCSGPSAHGPLSTRPAVAGPALGRARRVAVGVGELRGLLLCDVSNVALFNVISASPGDWTPRSPWAASEQLRQPRGRLRGLLPATRAPGRQGPRARPARRLVAPAGRCRWTAGRRDQGGPPPCHQTEAAPPRHLTPSPRSPPFPAAHCVPYVRPRTSRRPPASRTSTPARSVTARSATSVGSTPTRT